MKILLTNGDLWFVNAEDALLKTNGSNTVRVKLSYEELVDLYNIVGSKLFEGADTGSVTDLK